MSPDNNQKNNFDDVTDKLVDGYNTMLDKLAEWSDKADAEAGPMIVNGIKDTEEFLVDLKRWTKEEIDLISRYVQRDLHDAASKMEVKNQNFKEWFEFDMQRVEENLLAVFSNMADKTREELEHLKEAGNEWHTGEVTSIGTLVCKNCGKELHFHKPGRIPPCSACSHTQFKRVGDE
ncbi:zinc ribbon-containing protein [sulfur-oxidizing endosymbiont of Gigantopelta aegis]|uniref:zinc ribbon-containing protein n=1 Tax=sulfur-oxidizing endosymbiont of Gigantopelta aegis TaxID=2794934 RepID=UPI0018DB2A5A|nr:zinc ribbon-containing protein [sulfur-oxidizing endosymbiont of Gigantopelta aegis]